MQRVMPKADRKLGCRPPKCEYCGKRHLTAHPLEPWRVGLVNETVQELWLHNDCARELSFDETVEWTSIINLGAK